MSSLLIRIYEQFFDIISSSFENELQLTRYTDLRFILEIWMWS